MVRTELLLLFLPTAADDLLGLPKAPTDLTKVESSPTCKLSWTDNSDDEKGFNVYIGVPVHGRCADGATNWGKEGAVGANQTEYSWAESCCSVLENSCAVVRAFNGQGESADSNVIVLAPVC